MIGEPPSATRTNLPAPLTPLLGRETAVAAVVAMLRREDVRLVTLTGPGGVGKTRLALNVAGDLAADFADGVTFVELAPVRDPDLVASAVAQATGVRESADRPLAATLGAVLRPKRLLLVLDNLEHLLPAAPLVADLLAAGPGLKVLATSRSVLRVSGEHDVRVLPLAMPEPGTAGSPAAIGEAPAVRLFVARATAARDDFALTPNNAGEVAAICAALDGLPLAIELAAARINHLPPAALLARLTKRLPLLTGGAVDQPRRLRSMRDAIAWSYDLLDPSEQALLRRLAVFVNGFTLDAAEAVSRAVEESRSREVHGGLLDSSTARLLDSSVLDGVAALVAASLVWRDEGWEGEPRFRMLETVREFGLEHLAAGGEADDARRRHAAWCLDLAEQLWDGLAAEVPPALRRLQVDLGNVRAALDWLEEVNDAPGLLRLATATQPLWDAAGHRAEAIQRFERGLALGHALPTALRLRAVACLARHLERIGQYARARAMSEERLLLAQRSGDRFEVAQARHNLALVALNEGEYDRGTSLLESARDTYRQLGHDHLATVAGYVLGILAYARGEFPEAVDHVEAALTVLQEHGHAKYCAVVLNALGLLACEQGDDATAANRLAQVLPLWRHDGNREVLAEWLAAVARLAALRGPHATAARLYGAAEALTDAVGVPLVVPPRQHYQRAVHELKVTLGAEAFAAAWATGRALPLEQAVAEAQALTTGAPPQPTAGVVPLTPREREVLRLVAEGLTDRGIAAALFISERTVEWHLTNAFAKLGVGTRAAAAAAALRHGLL